MRTRAMQYFDMFKVRFKVLAYDSLPMNASPVVKTAFVALDGNIAMGVIPSGCEVDVDALRAITTARFIRVADIAEAKMRLNVPEDQEVPPIDLYGAAVYIDEQLTGYDEIVMPSGDPRYLLMVNYHDYARQVHPLVASITQSVARKPTMVMRKAVGA